MKVGILAASGGWHTDELARALRERGVESKLLPIDALVGRVGSAPRLSAGGTALDDLMAVLVRIIPRASLDRTIFRVDALHRLSRLGVPVVNTAGAIEKTVDKFYTSTLLEDAGIPTPPTVVAETLEDAMAAFRAFGDVIVKPLFGSNGLGMVRIEHEDVAYRVFRALEIEGAVYYVQRTIPHGGRDLRAFVVGGRVVAAAARRAADWRTNVARGGAVEPVDLLDSWTEAAVRAADLVGADYAGVDLLPAASGEAYVLEVNGIPGWKGLQAVTGVDIAGAVAERVLDRIGTEGRRPAEGTLPLGA
ncbi:MAG: RimK family alpha-L-glutamate ligase [Gemmatimonadota bacterium]